MHTDLTLNRKQMAPQSWNHPSWKERVLTCMRSHVCAVMTGLAKVLPTHWTNVLSFFLPWPHHPYNTHTHKEKERKLSWIKETLYEISHKRKTGRERETEREANIISMSYVSLCELPWGPGWEAVWLHHASSSDRLTHTRPHTTA